VNLDAFYADLMNGVRARAEVDQDFTQTAFLNEMGERLVDAEEIQGMTPVMFTGSGQRKRRLAVAGYDLDDPDGSVALAVVDFEDDPAPRSLTETDAKRNFTALANFVDEVIGDSFASGREESSPEVQLARDLRRRGTSGVTRYRLYLLTNKSLSHRAKDFESDQLSGVPVEYHVWDVQRLLRLHESHLDREAVRIDLRDWSSSGVPVLPVAETKAGATTYLCALPARLLADLYARYGSRLLEGNVRSYLSARGKVNKGIKSTVLSTPDLFIAFNNGITATASAVEVDEAGRALIGIEDLQIVNGGQTTASLFFVAKEDPKADAIDDVAVQAKIVVVSPAKARELVPQISRFANSQNKVNEADFFSNSPFHVRLEELSRRMLTPARPGVAYQTKWFYERTRGQYLNEKAKRPTREQRQFEAEYPRAQVITKTDAAKYATSWEQEPHKVSAGAQKNFLAFAESVAERWNTDPAQFNEAYFRRLVGQAILFNTVRAAVSRAEWYERGYLANIVAYTVAKLAHAIDASKVGEMDWDAVWQRQAISEPTLAFALSLAEDVLHVLTSESRTVVNVTEWAKKKECWDRVAALPATLPETVRHELVGAAAAAEGRRSARKLQKVDDGINAQAAVMGIDPREWKAIEDLLRAKRLTSEKDEGILALVTGRRPGVPSELQAAHLLSLRERAQKNGLRRRSW
jgi:hypothetical protein